MKRIAILSLVILGGCGMVPQEHQDTARDALLRFCEFHKGAVAQAVISPQLLEYASRLCSGVGEPLTQ